MDFIRWGEWSVIRACDEADFQALLALINAAAEAYRDIIPSDRWKEPSARVSALPCLRGAANWLNGRS